MNILTDKLPDSVEVSGRRYAVNTSFRAGIAFERAVLARSGSDAERLYRALAAFYGPRLPGDIAGAVDGAVWFYRCGRTPGDRGPESGRDRATPRAYDFDEDAERIYGGFMSAYGIDLAVSELHWWKFRALLWSLPEDSEFRRVVALRTMPLTQLSAPERRRVERLRSRYALKGEARDCSLEARDARWLHEVAWAYRQAQHPDAHGPTHPDAPGAGPHTHGEKDSIGGTAWQTEA